MTEVREETIEGYLCRRVKEDGGEVRKVKFVGRAGAPDRLAMLRGVSVFVEVKRPGKYPTDAQRREMERLEESGGFVTCWVNCPVHVELLLDYLNFRSPAKYLKRWWHTK